MNEKKINRALSFLRKKYQAEEGVVTIKDSVPYLGNAVILPQRVERRFIELKKMTENGTLEGISTLRFASFAPKGSDLRLILARELDIASYLGGGDVVKVFAVASGNLAVNVLAKLENGVNLSIEAGAGLPRGAEPYDRHEIIAKRGVASDQPVDTHTKHSSLRCWTSGGISDYTDVDTELFGLSDREIWTVRAAFALLQGRADAKIWNAAAKKAFKAADLAFESDKSASPKTISLSGRIATTMAIKVSEVR